MARKNRPKHGFSNLNRPPRPWEYETLDMVTGYTILNTDAVVDFWGRVVHKDTEFKPNPFEYKIPNTFEPFPKMGSAVPAVQDIPYRWLFDRFTGAIWYTNDYSHGQYPFATQAQILSVLPIVNDQSFNYPLNATTTYGSLVGTLIYTDTTGQGVFWTITNNPNNAFSINSATGQLYIWSPENLTQGLSYPVEVQLTSYYPGRPFDTAVITVSMVVGTIIINNSPLIVEENETFVATMLCTASTVTWALSGGADVALFTIDSITGNLSFLVAPDYDTDPHVYAVQVEVTNTVTMDVVTKDFEVQITDVIEGCVITSAANVTMLENLTAVQTMTGFTDTGGSLAWAITGGADAALFDVGVSSGGLSFLVAPDYENPSDADSDNVYELTVQLSDGTAFPPAVQNKEITITDEDEGPTSPEDFGSTHTWLDFDDNATIVTDGNGLVSITNKIGSVGGTFTRRSGVGGVTLTTSLFGGRQAAASNSGSDGQRLTSDLAASAYQFLGDSSGATVFVTVQTPVGASSGGRTFVGCIGSGAVYDFNCTLNANGASRVLTCAISGGSSGVSTEPSWGYNEPHVFCFRVNGSTCTMFVDAVSQGTATAGSDTGAANMTLNVFQQTSSGVSGTAAYFITEIVIHNEALDNTTVTDESAWLAGRAGF